MIRFMLIYAELMAHLLCLTFLDTAFTALALADWATAAVFRVTGISAHPSKPVQKRMTLLETMVGAITDCKDAHESLHSVFIIAREILL